MMTNIFQKNNIPPVSSGSFLYSLAIVFVIEVFHGFIQNRYRMFSLEIIGAVRSVEIILLTVIIYMREKDLSSVGLSCRGMITGIKKGLVWSSGFGCLVLLVSGLLFLADINLFRLIRIQIPESSGQMILFFLMIGLIGPAAEEIFFRGILYGFLRRRGVYTAFIVSISVFAAFHNSGHFPITQIIGGALFTISYEVEKNLFAPMTIHITGNLAMTVISLYVLL